MTILKYLMGSGVCTTAEILALKREHDEDYITLRKMAAEEMDHLNVAREDSPE